MLRSLTPNHRDILILLAERMLNEGSTEGGRTGPLSASSRGGVLSSAAGIDFRQYLALCQEGMLVSSDVSFRQHLGEMIDHHVRAVPCCAPRCSAKRAPHGALGAAD